MDLKELAKEAEGETGSDIEFICRKAASLAIRDFIGNPMVRLHSPLALSEVEVPKEKNTLVIKKKHFEEAIKLVKGQNLGG